MAPVIVSLLVGLASFLIVVSMNGKYPILPRWKLGIIILLVIFTVLLAVAGWLYRDQNFPAG